MRNYQILKQIAIDMYTGCILQANGQQAQKTCGERFVDMMATIKALEYQKNAVKSPKTRSRLMPFD
ncbi:MAG: hypothetical protein CMP20_09410 [Rickettsiales bacterium]|nr:hypothetical protein [Rickettsiales bacterium]